MAANLIRQLIDAGIHFGHRASRWNRGGPIFNESRWLAIMRTRAMDNQLCMVVARNMVQGSCVIDRKGEVLAWNEGDQDFVLADVRRADGYRMSLR